MKFSALRRFAASMALMIPVGIIISLLNVWMAWGDGVSFLTLAAVGTVFSMAALYGNPLTRRRRPERRNRRHA